MMLEQRLLPHRKLQQFQQGQVLVQQLLWWYWEIGSSLPRQLHWPAE